MPREIYRLFGRSAGLNTYLCVLAAGEENERALPDLPQEVAVPRLRQIPRSEITDPVVLAAYDRIFGGKDPVAQPGALMGTPGTWWTVFANSPEVMRHAFGSGELCARLKIDPVLRELGQTRAAWCVGSQYAFSQHVKLLRHLGVAEAKIAAVPGWPVSELFSPTERAVLAYADALAVHHGRVDEAVLDALRDELPDEQILELSYVIGLYVAASIINRALRLEYDDIPDQVAEVTAGPVAS